MRGEVRLGGRGGARAGGKDLGEPRGRAGPQADGVWRPRNTHSSRMWCGLTPGGRGWQGLKSEPPVEDTQLWPPPPGRPPADQRGEGSRQRSSRAGGCGGRRPALASQSLRPRSVGICVAEGRASLGGVTVTPRFSQDLPCPPVLSGPHSHWPALTTGLGAGAAWDQGVGYGKGGAGRVL